MILDDNELVNIKHVLWKSSILLLSGDVLANYKWDLDFKTEFEKLSGLFKFGEELETLN